MAGLIGNSPAALDFDDARRRWQEARGVDREETLAALLDMRRALNDRGPADEEFLWDGVFTAAEVVLHDRLLHVVESVGKNGSVWSFGLPELQQGLTKLLDIGQQHSRDRHHGGKRVLSKNGQWEAYSDAKHGSLVETQ